MDEFNRFFESLGVLAESSYAQYQAFHKAGFSEEQALELTKTIMQTILLKTLHDTHNEDTYE